MPVKTDDTARVGLLCLDGEAMMNMRMMEKYVEDYLNGVTSEAFSPLDGKNTADEVFRYNTAKRLVIAFRKYRNKTAGKDIFLISLRNYLLVFQNDIFLAEDGILEDNPYGIMKNADSRYYAALELPEYVDADFVNQAFQRTTGDVCEDHTDMDGVFYGTNSFIYRVTGYRTFKSLEQKLAVYGALNTPNGYTTLVSLPTGGGKSLITQTMAYQKEGLTIAVVPTVSLAIDQVRSAKNNLRTDTESEVFCYYSGMDGESVKALQAAICKERARLVFISPEALVRNKSFHSMIHDANENGYLKNLIIDEAHIVLEWGDFFRVDYQCLEAWRKELAVSNPQLRTILLSATFTRNTVRILRQMFSTEDKWIELRCDALRHEPRFMLVRAQGYTDKRNKTIELIKKLPHPMVVYVNSPADAEDIRALLKSAGIDSLETFTGKTNASERERIIRDWTNDEVDLIIATSAFGVGVDKGDVRTVLHLYVPNTPNQYYQELGRGGRDGLPSLSVMCIVPKDDIDSANKRMGKVLVPDKIWGRWGSMYRSETTQWQKGMVTLDTSVKPIYNVKDDDDDASDIDIQWNVYVVLLLRRYNLIEIRSMVYDYASDCYKIRVKILDDALMDDSEHPPKIIEDIRDREAKGFETDFRRISGAIRNAEGLCWSEMFFETYDLVSAYCGGCANHHEPQMMEEGKFPLLLPVRNPKKTVSAELVKLCQGSKESLLIGEEDDYSTINRYIKAGVSVLVLDDVGIQNNSGLLLNMEPESGIMVMGFNEFRELCRMEADYFISGGILAIYNNQGENAYRFCNILRKCRNKDTWLVHFAWEDYYLPQIHRPLSSVIDGPKIDSNILERI